MHIKSLNGSFVIPPVKARRAKNFNGTQSGRARFTTASSPSINYGAFKFPLNTAGTRENNYELADY